MSKELLIDFRKSIHATPEISGHETQTRKKVSEFLSEYSKAKLIEFAHSALLAVFDSGKPGHTVVFRSELDALPIQEKNEFSYKSQVQGVSHMCGHDGHSTILCGLALKISENMPSSGKVVLLFQPSEENGKGARLVVNDEVFNKLKPDFVFALHNLPGYPLKKVLIRKNEFTAAVKTLVLKFHGKTAHAAEPEHGLNPAVNIADIINESVKLTNNNIHSDDFALITPVYSILGERAYGISAGYGELHLTLRCWTEERMEQLGEQILHFSKENSKKNNIDLEYSWAEVFAATKNNPKCVDIIEKSVNQIDSDYALMKYPFKWGEDFGVYTQQYKGAMFGLGAGEHTPALHNPDYDFPDELIETGINVFNKIRINILG